MNFWTGRSTPQYYRKSSSLDPSLDPAERRPLLFLRHISLEEDNETILVQPSRRGYYHVRRLLLLGGVIVVLGYFCYRWLFHSSIVHHHQVIAIENAVEQWVDIGDNKFIWLRTWGRFDGGIPVLFVHGGPGQAVADYHNGNKRFFDANRLFVVEVDQRGTGNSQPSVRDDYHNMKLYQDISIDMIANDYEIIREYLGIDAWVVWGGSFGSTIGLNYCMRYPESCISLMLRGIYLDTEKEVGEVYTQRAFQGDRRKSALFDILLQVAQADVDRAGEPPLDPNDDQRLLRVYERMITRGDRNAIWTWHAFENNLMEDDPNEQLDPLVIDTSDFPEAQSVAFFETRLWLHGSFESPSNLLDRVDQLEGIPIWICQGKYDNVCPAHNARHLVKALEQIDVPLKAYFVEANHEGTDPVMAVCLKNIMNEFLEYHSDNY